MEDKEKVIEQCKQAIDSGEPVMVYHFYYRVIELLKEQKPKTGHWFISEYEFLTCSCCGESYYTGVDSTEEAKQRLANGDYYKFCPYCGAKMTDIPLKWN